MCVGQGAWEEELLYSTRQMDALLKEKNVPAWVDYWGHDVDHDLAAQADCLFHAASSD